MKLYIFLLSYHFLDTNPYVNIYNNQWISFYLKNETRIPIRLGELQDL